MLAHRSLGEGSPVTLLHGFTQRGSAWDEQIDLLGPGFAFLSVDLPGHGDSPDGGATMPEAAAGLVATWDALGIERSQVVGYSLGARLALWVACRYPQRVTTLATIGGHAGYEGAARTSRLASDRALADRIERQGVAWFEAYWSSLPMWAGLSRRGPEFVSRVRDMRRANRASGLAASLRGMGGAATEPFWDRLSAITANTVLLAGAEDAPYVEHARRMARTIPTARVAVVPRAGHAAHLELPSAVADVLRAHLERDRD
jgi:2-succinyl-6-hydroxy-2,4-cyclohexadiene-1-carboxylate synthase